MTQSTQAKPCILCDKNAGVTNGNCIGCVARYVLRTIPRDKLADSISKYAKHYNFEEQALRDERTKQWKLKSK